MAHSMGWRWRRYRRERTSLDSIRFPHSRGPFRAPLTVPIQTSHPPTERAPDSTTELYRTCGGDAETRSAALLTEWRLTISRFFLFFMRRRQTDRPTDRPAPRPAGRPALRLHPAAAAAAASANVVSLLMRRPRPRCARAEAEECGRATTERAPRARP